MQDSGEFKYLTIVLISCFTAIGFGNMKLYVDKYE